MISTGSSASSPGSTPSARVTAPRSCPPTPFGHERSLAVARSDDAADVEGLLRRAIEQLEDLGMLVHETTARLDLRDWLQAQGRAAEADEVAARCADQVRALGAVELLERL